MTSNVATRSKQAASMEGWWDLVSSLMGGTETMRAAGKKLMPQWPAESSEAYDARLATATLFPAYSRTVEVMVGKPMSKQVKIEEDMDAEMLAMLDSIDQEGNTLSAFTASTLEMAISYGFCGVLVDFQSTTGVVTIAQEKALGLRPYFVLIEPKQVLGWKAKLNAGKWSLQELRLKESVNEPDGEWGEKAVEQVRVLRPTEWIVYRKAENASDGRMVGDWYIHAQGAITLGRVPFVPFYGRRIGFMMGKPPMLDLAYLNVKHWQSQSDQDTLLHVARVPILTAIVDDESWKLTIGSGTAVRMPPGSSLEYTEHTGAAIGAGKTSLDDLKEEMRQSGAELLVLQPNAVTATQVYSEDTGSKCSLQRIVQGIEDSFNEAIGMMADWIGKPKLEGKPYVTLFKEFGVATMAEASAQILVGMTTSGALSKETLFSELKRRGILAEDVMWDDEQDRLSTEGPPQGKIDPLTGLPYDRPVPPQGDNKPKG